MKSVFDGLSEFVSRRGRMKVLEALLEEFDTPVEVAKRLEISRNAVYGWINEEKRHPSNSNLEKMLKILNRENEEKFRDFLVEELQIFQKLILKS